MGLPCTGLSYIIISEMTRVVSDFAYWFGRASSLFSVLLQMYRLEKLFYKHDLFYSVFFFFLCPLLWACEHNPTWLHKPHPFKPEEWSVPNFSLYYQCFVKQSGHENFGHDHTRLILVDILSTSPNYFCGKWTGTTNENSNFDLRVLKVKNLIGGEISYESLLGERINKD